MAKYLGETIVKQDDVEQFKNFSQSDWAMYFIESYGQIEGSHHKNWVLDQVARILKGIPVIIKLAKWDDGNYQYRVFVSKEQNLEYQKWQLEMLGNYDELEGSYEYDYDQGIAP